MTLNTVLTLWTKPAGALPRYPSGSAGAGGSLHGGSAAYGAGLLAGSVGNSAALPHSISTSALPDPEYGCGPPLGWKSEDGSNLDLCQIIRLADHGSILLSVVSPTSRFVLCGKPTRRFD